MSFTYDGAWVASDEMQRLAYELNELLTDEILARIANERRTNEEIDRDITNYKPRQPMSWSEVVATTPNEVFTAEVRIMQERMEERRMKRLIGRHGVVVEEEMNAATEVVDRIRRGYRDRRPFTGAEAVGVMLDALGEALSADMEQGGAAFNDAAHSEFRKKYPRFATLFRVAKKVDWSNE